MLVQTHAGAVLYGVTAAMLRSHFLQWVVVPTLHFYHINRVRWVFALSNLSQTSRPVLLPGQPIWIHALHAKKVHVGRVWLQSLASGVTLLMFGSVRIVIMAFKHKISLREQMILSAQPIADMLLVLTADQAVHQVVCHALWWFQPKVLVWPVEFKLRKYPCRIQQKKQYTFRPRGSLAFLLTPTGVEREAM